MPTAYHGSHERLHRLGQQRHAGHGQLRPQKCGHVTASAGLQACKWIEASHEGLLEPSGQAKQSPTPCTRPGLATAAIASCFEVGTDTQRLERVLCWSTLRRSLLGACRLYSSRLRIIVTRPILGCGCYFLDGLGLVPLSHRVPLWQSHACRFLPQGSHLRPSRQVHMPDAPDSRIPSAAASPHPGLQAPEHWPTHPWEAAPAHPQAAMSAWHRRRPRSRLTTNPPWVWGSFPVHEGHLAPSQPRQRRAVNLPRTRSHRLSSMPLSKTSAFRSGWAFCNSAKI